MSAPPPLPAVDLLLEDDRWADVPDLETLVRAAVGACLLETGTVLMPTAELSLLFCDDMAIRALNARWRGQDRATNVLSFPGGAEPREAVLLGDIAISWDTVAREAKEEDKSIAAHTSHLVVHGFLHLVGFDHESNTEADAMEGVERRIMSRLGLLDPYAGSEPAGAGSGP